MIGTHGRGFYVLDNIGVLRQATPELTTDDAAPVRDRSTRCAAAIATSRSTTTWTRTPTR